MWENFIAIFKETTYTSFKFSQIGEANGKSLYRTQESNSSTLASGALT